jgi:hypothetical protein
MFPMPKTQDTLKTAGAWLHRGFDATATWVTQLSWWKFLVFAVLTLIAGSILQDELFSSSPDEEVVIKNDKHSKRKNGDTNILIDDSGIHFNPRGKIRNKDADKNGTDSSSDERKDFPVAPPAPPAEPADAAQPAEPTEPAAPTGKSGKPAKPSRPDAASVPALPTLPGEEVHIDLPPQIGEELSNAIEEAVDDAAEQKVTRYHRQASTWFKSFVSLLVLALFGTKALMGGKKRAEAETLTANAAVERESMQRQLSEAKM